MSGTLLIIISHSPTQMSLAAEGLDAALTALILGIEVKVLLLNSGSDLLARPEAMNKLEQLLALNADCVATNTEIKPSAGEITRKITAVDSQQVQSLLHTSDKVLNF